MSTMAPSAPASLVPGASEFLGSGFVSGSFSADGVSDDVFGALGEAEGAVRQVCTCTLLSRLLPAAFLTSSPGVCRW